MSVLDDYNKIVAGLDHFRSLLEGQIKLYNLALLFFYKENIEVSGKLIEAKFTKKMAAALVPILSAAGTSTRTILDASVDIDMKVRDCFSIARSVIELLINSTYILCEGDDIADKANRHALQKSYRMLQRSTKVGNWVFGMKFTGIPPIDDVPGLSEALEEFTSKKGREKNWTDLSIDDRLAVVFEKVGDVHGVFLESARSLVYPQSSEILHGSVYGCRFFWGDTTPGMLSRAGDNTQHIFAEHLARIFGALFLAWYAFIDYLGESMGVSVLVDDNKKLFDEFLNSPFVDPKHRNNSD